MVSYNHLIIDEETRWIIEKIFSYALSGMGAGKITKLLIQEKIPTPSWINFQRNGRFSHVFKDKPEEKRYMWSVTQIKNILKDETYIGNSIHNRQSTVSFKSKKKYRRPESEWLHVENTHEAIISKDDFMQVQEMIKSRRREQSNGITQIFAGLVKCADCGCSLRFLSYTQNNKPYTQFICSSYSKMGKIVCSMHYIRYDTLYAFVLSRIQYWNELAHSNKPPKALILRRFFQMQPQIAQMQTTVG